MQHIAQPPQKLMAPPAHADSTGDPDFDRTIKMRFKRFVDADPTTDFYGAVFQIFTIVNQALWSGRLPENVIFAVNTRRGAVGHYALSRWQHAGGDEADEIAFNGAYLRQDNGLQFIQTLVHECCHLWQFNFGKPCKRGYHNKEFAREMRRVRLEPVNVGSGGSADTGFAISDRVIEGGKVDQLYHCLVEAGFEMTWAHALQRTADINPDSETIRRRKRESKTRYTCPSCRLNAWARPNALLKCGTCQLTLKRITEQAS